MSRRAETWECDLDSVGTLSTMHFAVTTLEDLDRTDVSSWLSWFAGTPLRLLVIALLGALTLLIARHVINTLTNHLADGTWLTRRAGREQGDAEASTSRLRANPLVSARRAQRARTIGSVLRSTSTLVIGSIVVLMILAEVGMNIAPLLASAGVVGVALGFGAQSLVRDFLSGMFLLLEDQYGVGDTITLGDVTGTVEAVALRITKIRDDSGTLWFVRNGEILRVGNRTQGWSRAVVDVTVASTSNLTEVRASLARAGERVKEDPVLGSYLQEDPQVSGIEALTADSVLLKLQVRTQPAMQWDVERALREAVRAELKSSSITLA